MQIGTVSTMPRIEPLEDPRDAFGNDVLSLIEGHTIPRAAEMLGKSSRTILRWIRIGKLPAKKVDGELRVDVVGVKTYIESDVKIYKADVMAEMAAEVGDLKEEVDSLKDQLATKDKQISELHVLLARTQAKQLSEPSEKP
jgi:excisionase family DNA binding protein